MHASIIRRTGILDIALLVHLVGFVACGGLPVSAPIDQGAPETSNSQSEVATADLAIIGGTLWDGTGSAPIPEAVVLIRGERIVGVGSRNTVSVPANARVLDASNKWIVPGLIDAHVHFFQSGGLYTRPDGVDLRRFRGYDTELAAIKKGLDETFRRYLAAGVTAAVDVGGPRWNFDVRERATAADVAPRVAVAGPLLSSVPRPQLDTGDPPIVEVKSTEEARAVVRAQLMDKPDLVKIWFIVADDRPVDATVPVVRAIIEEAHAGGVRVAVHATELAAARAAVEAGADVLVHSVTDEVVDDSFLQLLVRRGVILSPTLTVWDGYRRVLGESFELDELERRYGSPSAIASWRELPHLEFEGHTAMRESVRAWRERGESTIVTNLRRLIEAGVIIAAGSDAGNPGTLHGVGLHRELAAMSRAGMTNAQVLLSATRDAAKVFTEAPELGTLERGKYADLLILDRNPLEDLAQLQSIRYVVHGGTVTAHNQIIAGNPEAVVRDQVAAYNSHDPDLLVSHFSEGVYYGADRRYAAYGWSCAISPEI